MILTQSISTILSFTLQMLIVGYAINFKLGLWNQLPKLGQNCWLKTFFALSVGYAFNTTLLFILGITGLLTSLVTVAFLISSTILSVISLKDKIQFKLQLMNLLPFIGALLLYVIVVFYAIHPPGHFDDIAGHLPIARYYVEHHQILLQPYHRFPLFPQNMNLMFALGLMTGSSQTGGVIIAQFFSAFPVFITCLGLIGAFYYFTARIWIGFITSFLLLQIGPIHNLLGYAYVDNGLMLYCWASLLATCLSIEYEQEKKWNCPWLLMAGLMGGMAMGTKPFGTALVSFIIIWLFIIQLDLRAVFIYAGIAFMFGSWWYIRSWFISGDPFHPLGGNIFGYFLWTPQDLQNQKSEQATHGVAKNLSLFWPAILKAGVPIFAIVPFSCIFWHRLNSGQKFMLLSIISYFLFWFYATQVERYLAPIWAPAIFFAVWSLWQVVQAVVHPISKTRVFHTIFPNISMGLICIFPFILPVQKAIKKNYNQFLGWDEILEKRPDYDLMHYANTLIPLYGNRALNLGFEGSVFYYKGILIGDWFGLGRYSQAILRGEDGLTLVSPQAMRQILVHHRARTLLVNLKFAKMDLIAYEKEFTLQYTNSYGVLLTLK